MDLDRPDPKRPIKDTEFAQNLFYKKHPLMAFGGPPDRNIMSMLKMDLKLEFFKLLYASNFMLAEKKLCSEARSRFRERLAHIRSGFHYAGMRQCDVTNRAARVSLTYLDNGAKQARRLAKLMLIEIEAEEKATAECSVDIVRETVLNWNDPAKIAQFVSEKCVGCAKCLANSMDKMMLSAMVFDETEVPHSPDGIKTPTKPEILRINSPIV